MLVRVFESFLTNSGQKETVECTVLILKRFLFLWLTLDFLIYMLRLYKEMHVCYYIWL